MATDRTSPFDSDRKRFALRFNYFVYIACYMGTAYANREVKGSIEMLILALLEDRPRHGLRSPTQSSSTRRRAAIPRFFTLSVALRLEKRGLMGDDGSKAGQRRCRFYKLTAAGQKILAEQRQTWKDFFAALNRVQ